MIVRPKQSAPRFKTTKFGDQWCQIFLFRTYEYDVYYVGSGLNSDSDPMDAVLLYDDDSSQYKNQWYCDQEILDTPRKEIYERAREEIIERHLSEVFVR